MPLIPHGSFDLELVDLPEVLEARLAAYTTPATRWSNFTGGSPFLSGAGGFVFAGEVSQAGFCVRRIISYRNPFRPRLCGRFLRMDDGTRVEVIMQFPETRGALAWMGLVSVFGILASIHAILKGTPDWPFVLIPWAMVLFYWIMIQGSFWLDVPTSRRELIRILSGS